MGKTHSRLPVPRSVTGSPGAQRQARWSAAASGQWPAEAAAATGGGGDTQLPRSLLEAAGQTQTEEPPGLQKLRGPSEGPGPRGGSRQGCGRRFQLKNLAMVLQCTCLVITTIHQVMDESSSAGSIMIMGHASGESETLRLPGRSLCRASEPLFKSGFNHCH